MEHELKSIRFNMVIAPSQVAKIDAWRKAQDDIPSRSEAIRSLVDAGLAAPTLAADIQAALAGAVARSGKPESWLIDFALRQFLRDRGFLPKGTDAVADDSGQ